MRVGVCGAALGLLVGFGCGRPQGDQVAVNIGGSGFRTCGGECGTPVYNDPIGFCPQTQDCLANNNCFCRGFVRARSIFNDRWDGWQEYWSPGDTVFGADTVTNEYRCLCCKPLP